MSVSVILHTCGMWHRNALLGLGSDSENLGISLQACVVGISHIPVVLAGWGSPRGLGWERALGWVTSEAPPNFGISILGCNRIWTRSRGSGCWSF